MNYMNRGRKTHYQIVIISFAIGHTLISDSVTHGHDQMFGRVLYSLSMNSNALPHFTSED